ncbi:histone H2B.2 [Rosa chinensis]|nr:histone H2B.2 [Rosa chinensis]
MAPKRRSSSRLMVKTTKQVVKETVEVSVVQRKKRQKKVNDDELQKSPNSTIDIETKEENQTEKVEVLVDQKPARIVAFESQEENETPTGEDKGPVKVVAIETAQEQEGATPNVEETQPEEKDTDPTDKEPVSKDVAMETEQEQEESETQNFEEDREQAKTISMDIHEDSGTQNFEDKKPKVMTPEKKDDNQASKGEEEKSDDVKQIGEGGEKKEKKRKRRSTGKNREGGEGYKRYVYKVLKQVHPELGMSAKAMVVLNNYMNDMFDRLADEAAKLAMYTARKTLSSREIQGAVKLVLPGELGKHAMAEGTKAVSNYLSKNAARSNK